ncbi:MAG: hypothetical protein CVV44_16845 [Spirochaetae bacterium HGW-Spirochaetae-1]|nr:MAG: hypothetical protein CVV44_16845 [Spirochaetae bacterium HGW-Spirochaetae-1]
MKRISTGILLIFIVTLAVTGCDNGSITEKKSSYFSYSGYSSPAYKDYKRATQLVPMKDGVNLAVDVFLPTDGPPADQFPTVFVFTPYNRAFCWLDMPWWKKLVAFVKSGSSGPIFHYGMKKEIQLLLKYGYAFVIADMRGCGASTGSQVPFTPVIVDDGEELLQWISVQKWSNGKIGMMGQSYHAWIQLMLASRNPKSLKCIMPEVILSESFSEGVRPGGIDAVSWMEQYADFLKGLNLSILDPDRRVFPVAPVIDEDGDGDLADEIPLSDHGDTRTFLDDGKPRYRDGSKRRDVYYKTIVEHRKNIPFSFMKRANAPYFDSINNRFLKGLRFQNASPLFYTDLIARSGIPIYHVGGWFDGFSRGTMKLFATLQHNGVQKLHVAPRFHLPYVTDAYVKHLEYKENYPEQLELERLRFFDRYLKDIENGIDKEPPVSLYVMNRGWRLEKEWPLARQEMTSYNFSEEGRLMRIIGLPGQDVHSIDYTQRSGYGEEDINRWIMMKTPTKIMERTDLDRRCMVYETEPLAEDMEVTGHPLMTIYMTSNQADADVFIYLCDVDQSGRSLYVSEGQLRAGWHRTFNDDDQVLGKFDVQPNLPWHGYRERQFDPDPFREGKPVKLSFDLMPVSWLFKKGHRIRIAIAGADDGNFEKNPATCSGESPWDCPETLWSIYRGDRYRSRIDLPVIPAK